MAIMPRYPIYIPSKGRWDRCFTARFLIEDGVSFRLVVEPQEEARYAECFGDDRILVLPFSDRGSVIPARNWIKEHATEAGHERHWQLDDNIRLIYRRYREGRRIPMRSGVALAAVEDFADRYENVAVAGMAYAMFVINTEQLPPFYLNKHVYSCTLILNSLPHKWRGRYNEDTDYCLQVLSDGWCTILVNAFAVKKVATMIMKGGNTDNLYRGDGRLRMARSLERAWPGVVKTIRRFQRPQHYVDWRKFNTPLKRRQDIDWGALERVDEYGMRLEKRKEIKSVELQKLYEEVSAVSK